MPAKNPSEAAFLDEIRQLRARVASLESERQIPKEIIERAPVMISIVRAPDFVYELVNPAFQAFAPGKQFVGRRFADVWAEIPDPLVEILQNVIATGETFHLEDAPYTIERGPGMPPEVVYVTYSWIPLLGPDGKPDRILTLAHEVTGAVRQRQQLTGSIDELRRAEKSLRESEERFRVAQELSPDGFLIFRPLRDNTGAVTDFLWIYENDAAARMNDTDPKEVCGKRVSEVLPHHDESPFGKAYKEVAETGEVRIVEQAFYEQDTFRQRRWFRVVAVPSGGDVAILVQNVTERKKSEESLRGSEQFNRSLVSASIDCIKTLDLEGNLLSMSDGGQKLLEIADIDRYLNRCWIDFWNEEDRQRAREAVVAARNGGVGRFQAFCPSEKGNARWWDVIVTPILGADGKPERLLSVSREISPQKLAEEALRNVNQELERRVAERTAELVEAGEKVTAERQRFLKMLDTLPVVIDIIRHDGRIEWANCAYRQALGDNVGRLCYESQFGRSEPCEECQAFVPLKTGNPHHWEWTLPDGRTFDIHNFPFAAADGAPAILEMDIDITEQRRAQTALKDMNAILEQRVNERTAELRASEARERERATELQAILDAVPAAVFVAQDPECRTMIGSRLTYEMLRLSPGANVSKSVPSEQAPSTFRAVRDGREIPPEDLPAQKAASTGRPVRNYEFELVYDDGVRRIMLGDATPLFGEDGRPRGAVGAFIDVTERKQSEERLRQTQKLESVGLLAGGIAHDFNNILTGVMGNASLLLEDAPPERAETLRSIIASTERAAHLTRQLLAYSGKGQFIIRELDITQAVSEMADLVQFSIPKSVGLSLNLDRRLPPVAMDPGQLQQVLMNLVINAGEAIGEGNPGRITVTTSMADVESSFTDELGEEIPPGRYVCVEVHDTGSGIDREKKAKIFDPFFTTKFVGRGLGLAAVAGILRSQKGGIVAESEVGRGTTFRVFLPAAGRAGMAVQEPGSQDGRPAVLVVDDEVAVRDFISAVLRRKGYNVVQASDGQEAIAACAIAPGAIGAAIVDIIMPNMSANDLLPALKAKQPGMRILLTSGYSEAEARRLCAAYPGAAFIQKPYTAQQLAKAIDELVGVSGRPSAS